MAGYLTGQVNKSCEEIEEALKEEERFLCFVKVMSNERKTFR